MSWFSKFIVDPLKRYMTVSVEITPVTMPGAPPTSTIGAANSIIGALEVDLNAAIDAAIIRLLGPVGPLVQPSADAVLHLVEQHVNAYLSALFTNAHAGSMTAPLATA